MIAVTNRRSKSDRAEDAQLMKAIEKNTQVQIDHENQHNMKLLHQKVEFARDNLRTKEDHARRQVTLFRLRFKINRGKIRPLRSTIGCNWKKHRGENRWRRSLRSGRRLNWRMLTNIKYKRITMGSKE